MDKILLASPHMSDEDYEQKYVKEAFDTNWIAPLGKNVNEFENEIASYVNIKSAAALSSGTAAIHMAIKAAGVTKGDIVLCSTLTFAATVNPIIYEGAIPVFIDSEYQTWNMDPVALEKAFEKFKNVKAVVLVHLYGVPAKLDEIVEICKKHNVPLIEDSAESLGSTYKDKQTGTFGQFGIYSFNGNKIITSSGGGMVVSNDSEKIEKIKFWATQAREKVRHYQHNEIGYNYRMSNICAGIGRGQLKVLGNRIAKKNEIFNQYSKGFENIKEIKMQPIPENTKPNNWLSAILIEKTSVHTALELIEYLEKFQIESRPVWKPMHLQPVFEKYDFISASNEKSVAEDLYNRGVCLPSDTKMTDEQQQFVINKIIEFFN